MSRRQRRFCSAWPCDQQPTRSGLCRSHWQARHLERLAADHEADVLPEAGTAESDAGTADQAAAGAPRVISARPRRSSRYRCRTCGALVPDRSPCAHGLLAEDAAGDDVGGREGVERSPDSDPADPRPFRERERRPDGETP